MYNAYSDNQVDVDRALDYSLIAIVFLMLTRVVRKKMNTPNRKPKR